MAILIDRDIAALCEADPPLIRNFLRWEEQLQPTGFDFTVASIVRPDGGGVIRAELGRNVRATRESLEPDGEGYYDLTAGYYVVEFHEVVALPKDVVAFAYTRSTLIRYGGQLVSGVWDAGFSGHSRCGLVVHAPSGIRIQRMSALMQMVFHRLEGESAGFKYNHLYTVDVTSANR
jgi:dUTP pyrophosphatase